jgi:hypothetical protein
MNVSQVLTATVTKHLNIEYYKQNNLVLEEMLVNLASLLEECQQF